MRRPTDGLALARTAAFPNPPRLLPQIIRAAPELAVLALLDDAARTALVALLAQHPTLADLGGPREPPTLRRARRLAAATSALRDALDRYREGVMGDLADVPDSPDDDLPF
jgi:hypothetical protein